ncbi:P2X purinoceptor 7 [Biomphalaria pfeifferi]|uniref:P2X purinoceptor 7 n=1 Tax=Biomphalaria pfeifferi TaxID=112525 RepID=A0AAD8FIZ5_BIOPF|nr:P2X purinoceptor 7 [Biomphalaria pfeifferi]
MAESVCECCQTIKIEGKIFNVVKRIREQNPQDEEEGKCLAHWKAMDTKILNLSYLQGYISDFCKDPMENNVDWFYLACRVFTRWAFGVLGQGVRIKIPECVMKRISETFPLYQTGLLKQDF